MAKLRILVSLITEDNDYQREQASSAKSAAVQSGVDLEILYAGNDAITQSTQLLKAIQADPSIRPNGIVVEPLGATPFPKVAATAVDARVGWAVINRQADYVPQMRQNAESPIFSVNINQMEIGRIQAAQMAALLPRGGTALFVQGPSVSSVARERHEGLRAALPPGIQLVNLRGKWTEESGYQAVCSWMKLMTAQKIKVDLITAQNDAMAVGARKAMTELTDAENRDLVSHIPVTGCDGVPGTGQTWVRAGRMTATVVVPPTAGKALAMMASSLQTRVPPSENTLISPEPYPAIDSLKLR